MVGSYYNWVFYDVETQDIATDEIKRCENYTTIEKAKEYIKNTIELKCLDYNEKLVLIKREYDVNEDLIDEETIKEYYNKEEKNVKRNNSNKNKSKN